MKVIKRDGAQEQVKFDKISNRIKKQTYGLNTDFVDYMEVSKKVINGLYDGVTTVELDNLAAETAMSMCTVHPEYSMLAARIAISSLHKSTHKKFSETAKILHEYLNPKTGEKSGMIADETYKVIQKNAAELDNMIVNDRDFNFDYFGYKTLEKSYLLKIGGKPAETPQHMYMRVAVGIWGKNLEMVEKTYELLSTGRLSHATPTLFNSGTKKPQNSSCFLLAMEDDSIKGIYSTLADIADISQNAGGIGLHVHNVRAKGSYIKGTNGSSNGLVPMLKVFNETARYVDQGGGRRKGSIAIYLEPWHDDIFDFLDLRKNRGKEEMRARDLFLALWTPDLFMQRVKEDGMWTLMCPNECKGLSEVYDDYNDKAFTLLYEQYEREGKGRRTIKARELWAKVLEAQIETGTPYILYKDAANKKSNQKNIGIIKSSNLCCIAGDQLVPTKRGMLTIKELYDMGGENVVVGREKLETASEMYLPRPNAEMLKIITSDGYTHKVTPDHKVWVEDFGWKEAKDLVLNDKISIQQYKGLFGDINKPKEAFLMGLVAGDGTFSNITMHIDIWNENKDFLSTIEKVASDIIEENNLYEAEFTDLYKYENGSVGSMYKPQEKPTFKYCITEDNANKYRLSSSLLFNYFKKLGFSKENKLEIPEIVLKGNEETVKQYLKGLYYADGTITKNNIYDVSTIALASVNKEMLEKVQILLINFGIKSSIRDLTKAGMRKMPDGKGGLKEYMCQDSYRLLVTSKIGCKLLNDIIGIKEYRKSDLNLIPMKHKGYYKQKMYTKFVRSEVLPNEDAYCLIVDSIEHSWTVNGLITKNTEIMEVSTPEETAVCNLISMPLSRFIDIPKSKDKTKRVFNHQALYDATYQGTLNLNRVIDVNYYPTEKAKVSNMRHRPIGIGVQGLADTFAIMGHAFDSIEAKQLNKEIFETIYFASMSASADLAEKDGAYETFKGSPFSQGIFQFDMWGEFDATKDLSGRWDWENLKKRVVKKGVRNSLLLAPPPTASTAQILGNNEAFEPFTANIYKRNTLSGEYIVINKHLVDDLVALNLWNDKARIDIIKGNGSVQDIDYIPQDIKARYKTVWEISQKVVIDMAADRGLFIDQSQSMNLFIPNVNSAKLNSALFYGWEKGLKTGMYYMRTMKKGEASKSLGLDTTSTTEINVPVSTSIVEQEAMGSETIDQSMLDGLSCSLDNPDDCIACGA